MVIPWRLVLTAAAGILLAALWASRRGRARGVADSVPADVAIVVAIAAVVTGRLAVLIADVAQLGLRALDLRAAVTIGAGVSTGGALAGALAAGAWLQRRGKVPEGAWRANVPPVALGLALWSLLSLVRGSAAGIRAPFPLGWPLPGADVTRVPVGVVEAIAYAAFAVVVWRAERRGPSAALARMSGSRLAALLVAVAAAVHLLGGLLRASVPTVDGDIDVVLALLALVVAIAVVLDVARARLRLTAVSAGVAAAVVVFAALSAAPAAPPSLRFTVLGQGMPIVGDLRSDTAPPTWAEADLADYVTRQDVPVVVNVWASWCPPCRAEAPVLARAVAAYGDDVVFVGVNVDRDTDAARAFAHRYGLPFPSVAEAPGLRAALGVAGLPTTVVIRPDGSIAARIVGGVDARSLAAAVDRAR